MAYHTLSHELEAASSGQKEIRKFFTSPPIPSPSCLPTEEKKRERDVSEIKKFKLALVVTLWQAFCQALDQC